jgi:hypothetical protein
MQRDPLNILIVRCTGNFGSSCIIIIHYFVVNKSNYQGACTDRINGTAIVLDIHPVINWVSLLVSGWTLGYNIT